MKVKFYSFRFLFTMMLVASVATIVNAQTMYWRETFNEGGLTTNPGTSTAVSEYTGNAGTWYFMGVYRTTGTACENSSNYHIRNTNTAISVSYPDTPYVLTPLVNAGISQVNIQRGRNNRRITFYVTTDPSPTTSNWTLANGALKVSGYPNPLCEDTAVMIDAPTAVRMKIVFEGGTNNDVDSIALFSSPVLPVTFTGVSATTVNGFSKVTWNTATEYNTRSYLVEKSTDGVTFKSIAEVPATNAGTYNYIDQSALSGTAYYRVKALDKDGKQAFSGVIKLSSVASRPGFLITPNVIQGRTLNLQLSNMEKGTLMLRVSNNMGQIVYTSSLMNEGGAVSKSVQLPSSLTSGTYRVQLIAGSSVLTQTAILQ